VAELKEAADGALGLARGDVLGVIGIGHIGAGGCEEGDLVALAAPPRGDEERKVVFACRSLVAVARTHMERIGPARQIGRDLERSRRLPASIVEIVVMKMDRTVMLGLERPAM